ncbi:MAG: hypothetical protein VB120_04510 [Lachnospiraceae bacterium]|nr:hypothetical protein [Lachnospiraceae bacterium]
MFYDKIYSGNDLVLFNKILDLLDLNKIYYETKTESIRSRMADNIIFGGAVTLNSFGLPDLATYNIFVKKKDFEKASSLLDGLK